jgi:hypothetical protein
MILIFWLYWKVRWNKYKTKWRNIDKELKIDNNAIVNDKEDELNLINSYNN